MPKYRTGLPQLTMSTFMTDGKLPSGQSLEDAISTLDKVTDNYVSYYMINCAHPDHFIDVLSPDSTWVKRIKGIRATTAFN